MKKIRFSVFETNSSTTHTLTVVPKENFEAWQNGELFFDEESETLITEEESRKLYEEYVENRKKRNWDYDSFEEYREDNFRTYEEWEDYDDYLETFEKEYVSKSGDEIVIFGKYGSDS